MASKNMMNHYWRQTRRLRLKPLRNKAILVIYSQNAGSIDPTAAADRERFFAPTETSSCFADVMITPGRRRVGKIDRVGGWKSLFKAFFQRLVQLALFRPVLGLGIGGWTAHDDLRHRHARRFGRWSIHVR